VVIGDILVLLVTWMKTADIWKTSRLMEQFRPKLSMLLLRDGTVYFGALTVTNLVTLTLDVVAHFHPELVGATFFVFISQALGPILIARFILDLRSIISHPDNTLNGEMSTVHLSAILANLAAPIHPSTHHEQAPLWTSTSPTLRPHPPVLADVVENDDHHGGRCRREEYQRPAFV